MGTAAGIIIGIIVTVLVSRYYFLRSVNKHLRIYTLLDSMVFAGIAPDVKKQLNFAFDSKPVDDLQQLVFLVANSGDRAISNVIDPLALELPAGAEVLDVSVLHRSPDNLPASINHSTGDSSGAKISISFNLLNKGEFFVIKLLLSGRLETKDVKFTIVADDLPRLLKAQRLPPDAISDKKYKVDWASGAISIFMLLIPAWSFCVLHDLWLLRPSLFIFPWKTFVFDSSSAFVMIYGLIFLTVCTSVGLIALAAALFNGQFPPRRGPHFPLPAELQGLCLPIGGLLYNEDVNAFKVDKN
jgi:hypothetical protein